MTSYIRSMRFSEASPETEMSTMDSLNSAWKKMSAAATRAAESAKNAASDGLRAMPVPQADGDTQTKLESMWSKVRSSATQAAQSAKYAAAPVAATAGIHINVGQPSERGQRSPSDEEGLMAAGASEARGVANSVASGLQEELGGLCPKLTYRQRLIGALSCLGVGLLLDLLATLALFMGKAHIVDYAVFYSLGNATAICGSGFLVGPAKQARVMCEPVRRVACAVYLATLVATLVVACTYRSLPLIAAMLIVQYSALVWYGASFIPFGRACLAKACKASCTAAGSAAKSGIGLGEVV